MNKIFFGGLLLLLIILVGGCVQQSNVKWTCSVVECAESVNLTGEEWAQQNCVIREEGTFCNLAFENGQVQKIPLEQLNLSDITATQCNKYVCTREVPFRDAAYEINLSNS